MKNHEVNVIVFHTSDFIKVQAISELRKGAPVAVTIFKDAEMRKTNNPFLGHNVKVETKLSGYKVGTSYHNSCQNAAKRSGSNEKFQAKQIAWCKPFNPFFNVDTKSGEKFYLKLQASAKTPTKAVKTYFIDGVEATPKQMEELTPFLKQSSHTQSSSQTNAGITKENEQIYMLVNLDYITSIKQGSNVFRFITDAEVQAYQQAKNVAVR